MSSAQDLLNRFKDKPVSATTETPVTNELLTKFKVSSNPNIVANPVAEQQAAQNKAAIQQVANEVPAGIIQENPELSNIQGFSATQFITLLASTYKALIQDQPDLAILMEKIGNNLRQYEELSYLLNEDQLGLYIDGLMKLENINIKTKKATSTAAQNQLAVDREGGLDL